MKGNGQGKYLYCIINTIQPMGFPCAGVNGPGDSVYTILAGDLAAVSSDSGAEPCCFTRSTAMAHQMVIQEVMRQFTVLPFSFGTVANSEAEVRELLIRYREQFLSQLYYMKDKTEYSLKALWLDKEQPFREILAQRGDIRRYRDALSQRPPDKTYQERIQLGRLVQEALQAHREAESHRILEHLRSLVVEARVNDIFMDQMLLNAAFLLAKGTEPAFEEALGSLDREYEGQVSFRLVGPSPPFNFVHMPINWD